MRPAFLGDAAGQAAASLSLPWWRLGVLIALFAALLGVSWWLNRGRLNLRRLLQPAAARIQFHEQRWLNPRTVVCLVEVDGERFLLAQSQGAVAWQPLSGAPGKGAEGKNLP